MSRYIDADVPIKAIADMEDAIASEIDDAKCNPERYTDNFIMGSEYQLQGLAHAVQAILETPTADVREVVRGEWVVCGGSFRCSECMSMPVFKDIRRLHFCPNCGADMRGEQ